MNGKRCSWWGQVYRCRPDMKKLLTTVAMVVLIAGVTSANARDRHSTGTQMNHERSQKATGNYDGAAPMRTSSGIRHRLAYHRSVRRAYGMYEPRGVDDPPFTWSSGNAAADGGNANSMSGSNSAVENEGSSG
jgi:hypothetical protein